MSKKERKKRENEQIKILNSIINKKSHFESLSPLKKAVEYLLLVKDLENNMKNFPQEDKNKRYYTEYLNEIENLNDYAAEIFFKEKKYEKAVEIDKKLIKQNDKYHKSFKRLYLSLWALGKKEDAVIYGSFLLYRCDKKTKDKYYKDIIPEINTNLHKIAKEYQNKSWLQEIKITRGMVIQGLIAIICVLYLIKNYDDLKLLF